MLETTRKLDKIHEKTCFKILENIHRVKLISQNREMKEMSPTSTMSLLLEALSGLWWNEENHKHDMVVSLTEEKNIPVQ